jgi:hypothetical protein
MHDPWTDRLSEYMDGELDANEARQLEVHLASCDECTTTLAELRAVVARAGSLEDRAPREDLWAGIAAGIGSSRTAAGDIATPTGDIASLDSRRRRTARSFSFTLPQLAAAAVVLMSISAGAVWLVTGGDAANGNGSTVAVEGTIFQSVAPAQARLVSTTSALEDEEHQSLATLLEEARESLDPATVEVLERSLESIQDAIAAAEAALSADPGNPRLQRQLDSTLQRRQELAARVTRVQRGGA